MSLSHSSYGEEVANNSVSVGDLIEYGGFKKEDSVTDANVVHGILKEIDAYINIIKNVLCDSKQNDREKLEAIKRNIDILDLKLTKL